jgi:hypothetical protein
MTTHGLIFLATYADDYGDFFQVTDGGATILSLWVLKDISNKLGAVYSKMVIINERTQYLKEQLNDSRDRTNGPD